MRVQRKRLNHGMRGEAISDCAGIKQDAIFQNQHPVGVLGSDAASISPGRQSQN